jgi:ribosome-binding ATPase YchF (GTP1/OBG family)
MDTDLIMIDDTGGADEVRAWTIREGTKAPQAAGVIHSEYVIKFDSVFYAAY